MRDEHLVESQVSVIEMTLAEATELTSVGRRLSSQGLWSPAKLSAEAGERSVLECVPHSAGRWSVKVPNAVGIVRAGDLQLVVHPKIPFRHLLHLFERSGFFPRLDEHEAMLAGAESLWPLIAGWYLAALERLLRAGLASGYTPERAPLAAARGRILAAPTALAFLRGQTALECEFEEFNIDTPLNRVLKGAASAVSASPVLTWEVRRRASRAVQHLEGIGNIHRSDIGDARAERHTHRYSVPLQLARHVLAGTGRTIDSGPEHGYAFLIRTPEMVEQGIRAVIAKAMAGHAQVTKRTLFLSGSHHSLTPDLSFDETVVGDVKYKLWRGDWDRGDLYQLVTFATGFGADRGLRVGFSTAPHGPTPVRVGPVALAAVDWCCDADLDPVEAEQDFASRMLGWWVAA